MAETPSPKRSPITMLHVVFIAASAILGVYFGVVSWQRQSVAIALLSWMTSGLLAAYLIWFRKKGPGVPVPNADGPREDAPGTPSSGE